MYRVRGFKMDRVHWGRPAEQDAEKRRKDRKEWLPGGNEEGNSMWRTWRKERELVKQKRIMRRGEELSFFWSSTCSIKIYYYQWY